MSSVSYSETCIYCGAEDSMFCCDDSRYGESGTCMACGTWYQRQVDRLSLEELNEERQDAGLEPIEKLKERYEDI